MAVVTIRGARWGTGAGRPGVPGLLLEDDNVDGDWDWDENDDPHLEGEW